MKKEKENYLDARTSEERKADFRIKSMTTSTPPKIIKEMKKRTCKNRVIAKGNGEKYWKCIFCGQKDADPVQLTKKNEK